MASLMPNGKQQYLTSDSQPLIGGKVYTYAAGTTTPKATFSDVAGTISNANPVVLDARGEALIYWSGNYKIDVKDSTGVSLTGYPVDNCASVDSQISTITSGFSASSGAGLVGFSQTGASAAVRTVAAELAETIKLTQYYLAGEATVDSAFARAFTAFTRPGTLEVPQGFFNLLAKVQIRTDIPVKLRGAGMNATIISCTAPVAIDTMFEQVGAVSDTFEMSDMTLVGNSKTGSGYKSENVIASMFKNLAITGTNSVAIRANNGYSNTFDNVKLYSNAGGGLQCTGINNNNINVLRSQIYANGGIGIEIADGYSVNIQGCDIETNVIAGGMFYDIKMLTIKDNYVERNGGSGYAYTSPENITIKADFHILSSGKIITLVRSSDVDQCIIEGNQFTPFGTGNVPTAGLSIDSPIFCSVADGLRVTNNEVLDTTKITNMVSFYNNNTKSAAYSTIIDQNTVNSVGFLGTANTSFAFNTLHNIDSPLSQSPHNYASQDLYDYAILTGASGSIKRDANDYKGYPVYAVAAGDYQFGLDVNLTLNPELIGKLVWFGLWYHVVDTGSTLQLSLGGNTDTDGSITDTSMSPELFVFKSVCKKVLVSDTTLYIAVKRVGSGTNAIRFCNPVVSLVGFGANRYPIPYVKPTWKKNSAPSDGVWQAAERVVSKTPTVGQPKAFVCTLGGTPGTWVSEGNL